MGNASSQPRTYVSHHPPATQNDWVVANSHGDVYRNVDDLKRALRRVGVKKLNPIIGVDFTASNRWTGQKTYGSKNLHQPSTSGGLNPYEQAVTIIGESLCEFIDGPIPAYGFGCSKTRDRMVLAFNEGDVPCRNIQEVLDRYRDIAQQVTLAGPTSFSQIIQKACAITNGGGNQFNLLVIITDGQVTRPDGQPAHIFSPQEHDSIRSIVSACKFPLSIVCIGVGDGPFNSMRHFDDKISSRSFDNFRFVAFNESLSRVQEMFPHDPPQVLKKKMDDRFILEALLEVPYQYREIKRLNLLGMDAAYLSVRNVVAVPTVSPSVLRYEDAEPITGNEDIAQMPYLPAPGSNSVLPQALPGNYRTLPVAHSHQPVMIPTPVNMPPPPANMTYAIAPARLGLPVNSVIVAPISDCIRSDGGSLMPQTSQYFHSAPHASPAPPPMHTTQYPVSTAPQQPMYTQNSMQQGVLPPPMPTSHQHTSFNQLPPPGVLPPPSGTTSATRPPVASVPTGATNTYPGSRPSFDYTNPNPQPSPSPSTDTPTKPNSTAKSGDTGTSGGTEGSECPVCFGETRNVALQCGHVYCHDCAHALTSCAICRQAITSRIRLYT